MKTGLVLGKFAPLHKGHMFLIETAMSQVDFLYIAICEDSINKGHDIEKWIHSECLSRFRLGKYYVVNIPYNDRLSYTDDDSPRVAMEWAVEFNKWLPRIDVFFSSEKYGENFAKYMGAQHVLVDASRENFPIGGRDLRLNLYEHWDFLTPIAQLRLQRVFVFCGTESTGKTTATNLCAKQFAKYKPHVITEYGREVVKHSQLATYEQLWKIASVQTDMIHKANKERIAPMMFVDTDWRTTEGYRRYLFPNYPPIQVIREKKSRSTDYIFLSKDCSYVDDGTRLSKEQRDELERHHLSSHPSTPHRIRYAMYMDRMEQVYSIVDSLKKF